MDNTNENQNKAKRIGLTILSVPVAFALYLVISLLIGLVTALIGSIPIIGRVLDNYLDLEWVIRVSSPIVGIIYGTGVAEKVCGSKKAASVFFIVLYILALAGMILSGGFRVLDLIAYILAIVVSVVCFRD